MDLGNIGHLTDQNTNLLFKLAALQATHIWMNRNRSNWKSLGWSEVHSSNLKDYMNSIRYAAGFPAYPGTPKGKPIFDDFVRSRRFRIKAKCKLAVDIWKQHGSEGFEKALARLMHRDDSLGLAIVA